MTLDQWIGIWLLVAAAALNVATACLVLGGLWVATNRTEGSCGGGRGRGCRRSAGADGTGSSAEGSAGERLYAAEWPLGVIDIETVRRSKR